MLNWCILVLTIDWIFVHFLVIQSKIWKEWKKNKCQPNFWKEVCLGKLIIFVLTTKIFQFHYFKILFSRFIVFLISTTVLNTMSITYSQVLILDIISILYRYRTKLSQLPARLRGISVRPASQNPYSIYDQTLPFRYPIYDLKSGFF